MSIDDMPAGPELDALVAELMGTPFRKPTHGTCCTCQTCGWDHDGCRCGFSEYIEMAWEVVEKLTAQGFALRSWIAHAARTDDGSFRKYAFWFMPRDGGPWDESEIIHPQVLGAFADTAPLAICRAALKAVERDD